MCYNWSRYLGGGNASGIVRRISRIEKSGIEKGSRIEKGTLIRMKEGEGGRLGGALATQKHPKELTMLCVLSSSERNALSPSLL